MDLEITLAALGATIAVAVFCGWRGARPPNPAKGPRMVPYRAIMLLASAAAILMLVHLVNLVGLRTGR